MRRSSRVDVWDKGICLAGKNRDGHIDCLPGCSHPTALMLLLRVLSFPFNLRRVYGYDVIIKDEIVATGSLVDMPGGVEVLDRGAVLG